jgi:hypothetical protein
MAFIQHLSGLRSPVATYANLPLTDNVQGDLRIALDTGDAYTWMLVASSGLITDWNKVTVSSYSELIGAPYSTALDIDNAVKVVTGLSINIALLAFTTLTGYWSSLAKMFDGVINQFTAEDSGLEVDDCENQIYVNIQENTNGGYYLPNKGDLDIYTKMLIHGDGVQGSTSFVDLLRQPLTSSNAIVDLNIKKFGTGSIKFNGTNSSVAISDASGIIMGKYMKAEFYAEPMCLDFWFYSLASGLQPILANIAYDDGYGKTYDAGEYLSIQRLANGHIYANIIVTTNMGMTDTLIEVESASTVSDNAWHHIAIQKVGGYLQIWIDGVKDATSVAHVESENSSCQAVIKFGQLDTTFLNGYLDEIRLSNTERYTTTFTLMTRAYNTATEPLPTPVIDDLSDSDHTVTVNGNARMSGNNPLFGNASLYLDGIDSYLSLADSDDWNLSQITGSGMDEYTKLLLHLDNNVDDSEIVSKIVSNNGVVFSDSIYKFGTHSAIFEFGDVLTLQDSDDFHFGTGDFTIDTWVRFTEVSGNQCFGSQLGSNVWYFTKLDGNTTIEFLCWDGIMVAQYDWPWVASVDTWYHLALVRNGTNIDLYIDGIKITPVISTPIGSQSVSNVNGYFKIGYYDGGGNAFIRGYLDEYRISKGIARWTTNFTPPVSAYSSSILSEYTIDLWINPLDLTDLNTYIIGQDDSWKLTLDGTSSKYLKYTIVGGTSLIAPISLNLETWYHIAVVQKYGVIKLYVNGILGASNIGTEMVNGTENLTIGADSNGEHLFNGFIEEVRISDNARWSTTFTPPDIEYSSDSNTKLLLPLNIQTVPNMVLQSVGYVANYVPTSARVVIFEEDIDVMEPNVDLVVEISRDGGTTFTTCLIAKDQEFGDGTLNLFTGSVDLDAQPHGELLVWKLTTQNNKDCRIRGISLNWR